MIPECAALVIRDREIVQEGIPRWQTTLCDAHCAVHDIGVYCGI